MERRFVVLRKGFTLIELLVVIAIIAILAAILFPVFSNGRERGRQVQCISNLRQLAQAVKSYADDYNGMTPSVGSAYMNTLTDWCGSPGVGMQAYPEKGQIWPYTKNKQIYLCPSDKKLPAEDCGNIRNYALSYSMNWKVHQQKLDAMGNRLSRILFFLHEGRKTINDGLYLWWPDRDNDIAGKIHWEGTTLVYVDGHAKWKSFLEIERERKSNVWDPKAIVR